VVYSKLRHTGISELTFYENSTLLNVCCRIIFRTSFG